MRPVQLVLISVLALWMTGCGGTAPVETGEPTKATETKKPATRTAAPADLVIERRIDSTFITEPVTFHVFLPPSYEQSPDRDYPVIYWLHGSGGFPPGVLQGLSGRFNGAMTQNKMPEALVVFPDGFNQSMWTNSKDLSLPMEDIFIQEIIPLIEAEYRVVNNAKGRIIEGGSMGGYGAARFGFKYTDMFAGISMLNPGPMQKVMNVEEAPIVGREGAQRVFDTVYGGDQDYFLAQSPWQLAADNKGDIADNLKIRLILGADDPITPVNRIFSEHLNALGIEHELILLPNAGHNPREMFAALGEDYWTFFNILLEN